MPPGLADAVQAVLTRDRDVPPDEAAAIARLAAPDDAVAEVQVDLQLDLQRDPPAGALAAVIGFAAPGTHALLAGVAPAAARPWLAAVAPGASHWGAKLGRSWQLYARGHFSPADAIALGAPARSAELAAALALAGAPEFAMLGIELAGGAIARHVGYAVIAGARGALALARARGVSGPIAELAPDQAWLHLSWDLATTAGPLKIDSDPRQLGDVLALAARLGLPGDAIAARLAALGLGDPSHVGLRAGAPAERALTLYFRVTAS